MYVSHLSLLDFRCYEAVDLELEPGVNALVGPNGQGKTNLVEAVGYVATLGSHRVAGDTALIRAGAARAVVRTRIVRGDRASTVELEITAGKANRARINRGTMTRARDVLGLLHVVVFAPEDLVLVKGDPDARRSFLDGLMVQLAPRLSSVLSDYEKVVRQRSALLKSAGGARRGGASADLRTLDVWDAKLAMLGAQIMAFRYRLVRGLAPYVRTAYDQVSAGQGEAVVAYRPSLEQHRADDDAPGRQELDDVPSQPLLEARLLETMSRVRSKELDRGVCLVGPHRDDLLLTIGGLPAKGYASHGESWSLALALRLGAYDVLTLGPAKDAAVGEGTARPAASDDQGAGADPAPSQTVDDWFPLGQDAEPVLVLDDVFAELDVQRRERLAHRVASASQVLVTAAVPGDVPEELSGARFDVMGGEVTRVV